MTRPTLPIITILAALLAPAALAQAPADSSGAAPAAAAVADPAAAVRALDEARAHLREGDYDRSIEVLKPALGAARGTPEQLREVYLLLIKTYCSSATTSSSSRRDARPRASTTARRSA